MSTRSVGAAALVVALFATARPGAGQEGVWIQGPGRAWLGISYETEWVQAEPDRCEPRFVVEHVVHGSPAERAGLREGDAIVALDDEPVAESGLRTLAARLSPGDAVRLRLERDGRIREMVAIADERPDRPASLFIVRRSGLDASAAPVVRVRGDTLLARNVEALTGAGSVVNGYWLARGDDTEFRPLEPPHPSGLDRRVKRLVDCVGEERTVHGWLELRNVQERADSLRVRMVERALEQRSTDGGRVQEIRARLIRSGAPEASEQPEGRTEIRIRQDGQTGTSYIFRVEDQLLAGMRGVAGAELVALEPELAEYFRNVTDGLLVLRVSPGTPAGRAGLRPGDVVRRGAGSALSSVAELRRLLTRPGPEPLELEIVRKGQVRTLTLPRR